MMPKRTKEFQQLVARVYKQMAGSGDAVTESAMLKERCGTTQREIDILLEKEVFGTRIRIAVECRGRSAKDDVKWIDGLIGKYDSLDVDKLIAVSKSGFTRAAQEKARMKGIEMLTLKQALKTNWPAQFERLGMALVARYDRPDKIQIVTEPPVSVSLSQDTILLTESGHQIGTIQQVARNVYERRRPEINAEIGKQFLTFFKTLGDLSSHKVLVELFQRPTNPIFLEGAGGDRHRVTSFIIKIECSFSFEPATLEHYVLGEAQVSEGSIPGDQDRQPISVTMIQIRHKPKQVRIHWKRIGEKAADKEGLQKGV